MVEPIFRDRADAGRILAEHLSRSVKEDSAAIILSLPRGGVPVAFEVARTFKLELDVFLVRKLGLPGQEELAIGALASGGLRILNKALIAEFQLSPALIDQITAREQIELRRREQLYRRGRPALPVRDRSVILIDDGLATGASMKAACQTLQLQAPRRLIVAVPVAAQETCDEFRVNVDQVVCAFTPSPFIAVGIWYRDFSQTSDEDVRRLLETAERAAPSTSVQKLGTLPH